MKNKILLTITIFLMITPFAMADYYTFMCWTKGQVKDFTSCNPGIPKYTCEQDSCKMCVKIKEPSGAICPTNINVCNNQGGDCHSPDDPVIDIQPPVLTVNKPVNNSNYNTRSVYFDIGISETSRLSYIDNANKRSTSLCSGCKEVKKSMPFRDGEYDLTLVAKDVVGNNVTQNLVFTVDSLKPRVISIGPQAKFIATDLYVEYNEDNLFEVKLKYGNASLIRQDTRTDCPSGKKQRCTFEKDLAEFEGQQIKYWFELKDIAGNNATSKVLKATVDETFPMLNNPETYWSLGAGRDSRYVYFNMSITETNFAQAGYTETIRGRERFTKLCSRLKNGLCTIRKSFSAGEHDLHVTIEDKAGNTYSEDISFNVV